MKYRGVSVSGKMLAGKGTFLKLFRQLTGNSSITNLAFADKVKVLAKYILVCFSRTNDVDFVCSHVGEIMRSQLFTNSVALDDVVDKLHPIVGAEHILEFAKPGLKMGISDPLNKRLELPDMDFGIEDIDASLWFDCAKPRKLLQEIGTECVRSIQNDAWVRYAFNVAERHRERFFIITDSRFPNEVDRCKKEGFLDVRIEASQETRLRRGFERDGQDYSSMLSHPSETSLDDYQFSVVVSNEDDSMQELTKTIRQNPVLEALIYQLQLRNPQQSYIGEY